jgi:pyruvate dehydrogenase E1 component alpha subunit
MVGGSIGLSTGGGFALKHKGKGNAAVALFGDGALDEGIAYEALNIASLYSLPVLFLCENNSKEGEAQTSRLATKELTAVPKALKIESATVDGGDAEAAATAAATALAHVRAGEGPYFLEAELVRWPGSHQIVHEFTTGITDVSAAWNQAKASNEHAEWQRTDPILRLVRTLLARNAATRDEVLALDSAANDAMAKARAYAEASPYPKSEAALAGVFV